MHAALLAVAAVTVPDPAFARGRAMIDGYFREQVRQIEAGCLADLTTKADWEKRRPGLRRQFLEMMGLWPMPPRTDLKAVVTGKAEADTFTVERLHFQSRPGLYVTANLYMPKNPERQRRGVKFPAILYVCGHATVVENGVAFGSKAHYQYHPAWFAAHGYVCLALDTLQLGEIPGHHHGTHRMGRWWWHTRGYTPAGVELWNAIRAIDYLESRLEVDPKRIGVTGRSGGGATTWWVAAADDRPRAFAPVAGIADLRAHVVESYPGRLVNGAIAGHCDCMYFVNTHRWDFPLVAALAAPRPVLLGNSDADDIFPVPGYRRIAAKVRKVYALYAADEKFRLLETAGPHRDTPELRIGINRWMNRWLKDNTTTPVEDDLPPRLKPQQLKVLDRVPEGAVNETIDELFVRPAVHELPEAPAVAAAWWAGRRGELLAALRAKVFAGWPKEAPPPAVKPAADVAHDGVRLRAFDFTSETGIGLRLFVLTAGDEKPGRVILSVLDGPGWDVWCRDLGPEFAVALQLSAKPHRDAAKFAQNRSVMRAEKLAFAAVCPRGVGPTAWAAPGSRDDTHIRRRFPLVGQTLDGQRVWDARRAVAALAEAVPGVPVRLHGEREAAAVALYAGLFEPGVAGFDLWHPPAGHRDGPALLNVATVLDLPQAVVLAAPRPVAVFVKADADRKAWDWPLKLQAAAGGTGLTVKVSE
jgi:dienelactone hydrolase